jgi:uncharacterized protein (TIGR00297 family)
MLPATPEDGRRKPRPAGLSPAVYRAAATALAALLVVVTWTEGTRLPSRQLAAAAAATLAFAIIGWAMRAVSLSGAVAGACIAFVLWANGGPAAFIVLMVVFAVTALATRSGRARKLELGLVEPTSRTAPQVVANLYAGALFLIIASHPFSKVYVLASVAALAEAAADTVSSEMGKAWGRRTWLISTFRPVAPGTDGGISSTGTLFGIVAALLVGWSAAGTHLIPWLGIRVVAAAAVLGMFTDSILGALLERRGWLTNDGVNALGTTVAGLIAIGFARL